MSATYLCGEQVWFSGWLAEHEVTYQVMDTAINKNFLAVGGYTKDINSFDSLGSVNANDDKAAVILIYDVN